MKTSLRVLIGVLISGALTFPLGVITGRTLLARRIESKANVTPSPLLVEGFDFNALRALENEWRGPNLSEKIDLGRLRSKDEKTLADAVDTRPIMLVSINPSCAMCRIARDEMIYLRTELSRLNVDYHIVSFTSSADQPLDFFTYADSLKVGSQSFLWSLEDGPPSEAIFIMTNPSHLLLNANGTVIRVWPGSYENKAVRERMARQILADTIVVIETLNAVPPEELRNSQTRVVKR